MKVRLPKQPSQQEMMKQIAQMQQDMQTRQEQLDATQFSATSGGGAVKATVTGAKTVTGIKIDKDAVDLEDIEMLEDLVCAAVNEALSIADKTVSEEMEKITGSMNIPGMPGMF